MFVALTLGGLIQGFALYDPVVDFVIGHAGGSLSRGVCARKSGFSRSLFDFRGRFHQAPARNQSLGGDRSHSRGTLAGSERMNRLPTLVFGIFLLFVGAWLGVVGYSYLQLGVWDPRSMRTPATRTRPRSPARRPPGNASTRRTAAFLVIPSRFARGHFPRTSRRSLDPAPPWPGTICGSAPHSWGQFASGPISPTSACAPRMPTGFTRISMSLPRWPPVPSCLPTVTFIENKELPGGQAPKPFRVLKGPHAPEDGYEVVPSEEARVLVTYLLSLRKDYPLPEAEPLQ